MKKLVLKVALFALVGGIALTSCDKAELLKKSVSSEFSSDEVIASEIEQATEEDVYEASMKSECNKGHFEDCAIITEAFPEGGDFPKVITVDFGTEGCNNKSGKIIINISDNMKKTGAQRVVTFDNFYRKGNKLEGSKTTINIGINENGNTEFNKIESTTLTKESGEVVSKTIDVTKEWIAGFDTEDRADDEFLVSGTEQMESSERGTMTKEISSVHKSIECKYPLSGMVTHTKEGETRSLDFGDGSCDNEAVGTDENGETKVINLDELPHHKGGKKCKGPKGK